MAGEWRPASVGDRQPKILNHRGCKKRHSLRIFNGDAVVDVSSVSFKQAPDMKSARLLGLVLAVAPVAPPHADGTFTVTLEQAVTIGGGDGDTFGVERISRTDNTVTVLLRPRGEDCTFRFSVGVGQSVQLRTDGSDGQSLLCWATLRLIIDDTRVQFAADCAERPSSTERKCPPSPASEPAK